MTQGPAQSRAQRAEFQLAVAQRETPRALAVACGCFIALNVVNSMVGPPMAMVSVVMNGFVAVVLLVGALAIRGARLPSRTTPWITALCALMLVTAGQVQVWLKPDGSAFAYILLIMLAYCVLTLGWTAAITVAVPMLAGCVLVATRWPASEATDWVIAAVAALAIGMALLWLRLRSIDELGEVTALVNETATRDRLTGALNRRGVEERLPELVALAKRQDEPVFAAFADIDGLKEANDLHGHHFGDEVIVAVANAFRSAVREADVVGRWGGDEFIVLGLGLALQPEEFAARVNDSIRSSGIDLGKWAGGVSIGVAVVTADHPDLEDVIRLADEDMYLQRRSRRGK